MLESTMGKYNQMRGVTPIGMMKPQAKNHSVVIDLSEEPTHIPTGSTLIQTASTVGLTRAPSQTRNQDRRHQAVPQAANMQQRHVMHPTRTPGGPVTKQVDLSQTDKRSNAGAPHVGTRGCKDRVQNREEESIQKRAIQGFQYVYCNDEGNAIQTPGGRCYNINKYLMSMDQQIHDANIVRCPALMNGAIYDASRFSHWLKVEAEVMSLSHRLPLSDEHPLERFRTFTLMSLFRFFTKIQGRASTIHFAASNLNRVVASELLHSKIITPTDYAGVAMACIRMAIKHEDTLNFNRLWQNPAKQLWEQAGFGKEVEAEMSLEKINETECVAVKLLQHPSLTPPSPLDFLERYLCVGGWPAHLVQVYRDLAHYIIDLSLFAPRMDGLTGSPPSMLAGAALMLSIKIHNAMEQHEKWEYWPPRLEVYTDYSEKRLSPVVRCLCTLIRNKPHGEELLAAYHKSWYNKTWS